MTILPEGGTLCVGATTFYRMEKNRLRITVGHGKHARVVNLVSRSEISLIEAESETSHEAKDRRAISGRHT